MRGTCRTREGRDTSAILSVTSLSRPDSFISPLRHITPSRPTPSRPRSPPSHPLRHVPLRHVLPSRPSVTSPGPLVRSRWTARWRARLRVPAGRGTWTSTDTSRFAPPPPPPPPPLAAAAARARARLTAGPDRRLCRVRGVSGQGLTGDCSRAGPDKGDGLRSGARARERKREREDTVSVVARGVSARVGANERRESDEKCGL